MVRSMITLKRSTKYTVIVAAIVAVMLPSRAEAAAPPPIPTNTQCRVYGFVATFLFGPARGRAATKRCVQTAKRARLAQPLPASQIPDELERIRDCESGDRRADGTATPGSHSYAAENKTSTASGAYQYLDSTWGVVDGYSRAVHAPPGVQDRRALRDYAKYQRGEADPWRESASCWGR